MSTKPERELEIARLEALILKLEGSEFKGVGGEACHAWLRDRKAGLKKLWERYEPLAGAARVRAFSKIVDARLNAQVARLKARNERLRKKIAEQEQFNVWVVRRIVEQHRQGLPIDPDVWRVLRSSRSRSLLDEVVRQGVPVPGLLQ
jgi:hypothetical protein